MFDHQAIVDERYYLSRYPDVASANISSVQHFTQYGWREGRFPSARVAQCWQHASQEITRFTQGGSYFKWVVFVDDLNDQALLEYVWQVQCHGVSVLFVASSLGVYSSAVAAGFHLVSRAEFDRCGGTELVQEHSRLAWLKASEEGLHGYHSSSPLGHLGEKPFNLIERVFNSVRRVSVVVPNYNYQQYLIERLDSIFGQSYPVYEVIVLDDASSDNSLKCLAEYQQQSGRQFAVLNREANSGSVFYQWQQATAVSTGEYLWIAEADDSAAPNLLESFLVGDGDFQMACADAKSINEHGELLHESYNFRYRSSMRELMNNENVVSGSSFVADCLGVENQVLNVSGVLFRRLDLAAVFHEHFDELLKFRVAGDWFVYVKLLLRPNTRIKLVGDALNVHRIHESSVTQTSKNTAQIKEIELIQSMVLSQFASQHLAKQQRDYIDDVYRYFELPVPLR